MQNLRQKILHLILVFQLFFIVLDLIINSIVTSIIYSKLLTTFLFIIQDGAIILSISSIIFNFYSSEMHQMHLLYKKFRVTLLVIAVYFVLCVLHHVWLVFRYQELNSKGLWPTPLTVIFIIQRTFCVFYYYFFKRTALKISEPGFAENVESVTRSKVATIS